MARRSRTSAPRYAPACCRSPRRAARPSGDDGTGASQQPLKDFYDIWILSRSFSFDGDRLPRAIAATFARHGTMTPQDLPDALTPAFVEDAQKQRQWRVCRRRCP
ncbi:nucleotidyl transferase AbiEii/AbiGii toxin family protein [Rhizobium leguminosarum]|uniref:nucleotidyl transferase AbiEii/AbiGii toxin family protein n=1 Tax=Rhizobium leguminosarum TaxID=384 RepID=UPI0021BC02C8|nr:nucleotidyl transferase AbiEii/AbiGii toxin family protein [Rhizobium leguminosarum]